MHRNLLPSILVSLALAFGASAFAESVATLSGAPSWKVKNLRVLARDWSEQGLGVAIKAVAVADTDVKTGAVDPEYALERMLIAVGRARRLH